MVGKSASLWAACLLFAATPAWSRDDATSLDQQLIHLDTALAAALHCDWVPPVQRLGLAAAIHQSRAAILAAEGADGLKAAEKADRLAQEPVKTLDCTAAQAAAIRVLVQTTADEAVDTHLFRAHQIATLTVPWAAGVSKLQPLSRQIATAVAKETSTHPERMSQIAAVNSTKMAAVMLAINCEDRKGPRAGCPAIGSVPTASQEFAKHWLGDTELFVQAYFAGTKATR